VVLEQIIILLVDLGLGLVFALLLVIELEILTPSWAIFYVFAHLIFALAWETSMVLD
jgi:hypothetical protein